MTATQTATQEMTATQEACETLCQTLKLGNDVHRCFAAQALGHIADPRALDALLECLMDEDEDVRIDAAEALGALGDARAGGALLDSLRDDPCNDVKINAVEALGRLACREAVPVLRRLVRSRDESLIWDEGSDDGWDDWLDVQIKAIEALGRIGAVEAFPDIAESITDEMGQDVSEQGMTALAWLGTPGIAALTRFLDAADNRLRRRAAAALAEAEPGATLDALARALTDDSSDVRLAAVRGWPAEFTVDPRLAARLEDAVPEVRAEAVRRCGRLYPERVDALLDDPDESVQTAVVELIGADPGPMPLKDLTHRLRVKLHGPSTAVAAAAASALAALDPDLAFADLGGRLLDNNCPAAVRCAAARALAGAGAERAAHALLQALADDDRQVRLAAAVGLARIAAATGSELACEGLTSALNGALIPPPGAAATAQTEPTASPEATGDPPEMGDDWPASTLEAILGGDAAHVAEAAREGAVQLDAEDLAYLELARRVPRRKRVSPEPGIAAHEDLPGIAARVLGDVARADVARALANALADGGADIRRTAADSLVRIAERMGRLDDDVVETLVAAAEDADRDVRQRAVRALGLSGNRSATPVLIGLLDDRDGFVRAEATRALGRLGDGGPEVAAMLMDGEPGVRLSAAEAIATLQAAAAVDRLVDFAFAFHGYHRREAARLLRGLDAATATARFIATLDDPKRKPTWRIAIEALDELHRRDLAPRGRWNGESATESDWRGDRP